MFSAKRPYCDLQMVGHTHLFDGLLEQNPAFLVLRSHPHGLDVEVSRDRAPVRNGPPDRSASDPALALLKPRCKPASMSTMRRASCSSKSSALNLFRVVQLQLLAPPAGQRPCRLCLSCPSAPAGPSGFRAAQRLGCLRIAARRSSSPASSFKPSTAVRKSCCLAL